MQSKILVVLSAIAILGVSSPAMARGGSGGMAMHGHGHFVHNFHFKRNFVHNFRNFRNPIFLGGWDWGLGGYGDPGYGGNNTVVVFPQATPQAANVTGSVDPAPCKWNQQDFTVPSSAGGTRPVQLVSCH
jgi:hypothetical protein